ncbi:putative uncharacterized protein [Firmicutes bacterium CAG:308]|nr:putative uncharacterized protein [Firmicutes bacterium CAG:308]
MKKIQVKELCISALGICLVFCATFLIKIPNGFQGYFNCGDGMILAFAPFVNPLFAFLIGGVGSAIADIVSGYASYALFTLVIKGIEGLLISILISRFKSKIFVFFLRCNLDGNWLFHCRQVCQSIPLDCGIIYAY